MLRTLYQPMGPPRVLFCTSEIAPLIKTGGLADVSASLPRALAELGCDLRIVLPGYRDVLAQLEARNVVLEATLEGHRIEIVEASLGDLPRLWLVCCAGLFDRPGNPYLAPDGADWPDNAERFALFGRAIALLAGRAVAGFRPDLVHLNDWQTGIAGALLGRAPGRPPRRPKLLFTIHNLHFQGLFDGTYFQRLALPPELASMHALEFHGRLSFIKGGIVFADTITTVSPHYAEEIQTPELGCGLDGLLRHRSTDLRGVLNGIDTRVWNPALDDLIPARYDIDSLHRKALDKQALLEAVGLPPGDGPLLGMVSRLTHQKGIDLVLGALPRLLEQDLRLVVLGSGTAEHQGALHAAAAAHPGRVAFANGYSEPLAHLVEAGADIFLMPSRFEPCGLNQMYSMAYGTPPVVRRTGGLADTVVAVSGAQPSSSEPGTGFLFDAPTPAALTAAVRSACATYRDTERWRAVQRNGMRQDFSWNASARRYLGLYEDLVGEFVQPEPRP